MLIVQNSTNQYSGIFNRQTGYCYKMTETTGTQNVTYSVSGNNITFNFQLAGAIKIWEIV